MLTILMQKGRLQQRIAMSSQRAPALEQNGGSVTKKEKESCKTFAKPGVDHQKMPGVAPRGRADALTHAKLRDSALCIAQLGTSILHGEFAVKQ